MNQALFQPIEKEPTVGPRRAPILARLGIRTPADVLFQFPRSYDDFSNLVDIAHLEADALQTVCARVVAVSGQRTYRGTHLTKVAVEDSAHQLADVIFFNQRFRLEQILVGQIYLISGKPRLQKSHWQFAHPVMRLLTEDEVAQMLQAGQKDGAGSDLMPATVSILGLQPIYRLTEGLPAWEMRRIARQVVMRYADALEDVIPTQLRERWNLAGIADAVRKLHFPGSQAELEFARRRFVFQELLLLQLALGVRRKQQQVEYRAPVLESTPALDRRIRALFPYDLTDGQLRAIADITQDTASGRPMNRLLQGDVGCGKTSVALYAMLLAVAQGYQAAIMAPTEVLAQQHFRTFTKMLTHSPLEPCLLVGGLPAAERREKLARIADGSAKIVIGTQALLQGDVEFQNLGIIVIDEQHKFGVRQRASLRSSGAAPHYLVMTATPIPRTVSMTLFGDLDITSIRDLPPGRQKVHTYLAADDKRAGWWEFFRSKLAEGAQGYVVVPRIGLESGEGPDSADPENAAEPDPDPQREETSDGEESEREVANLMKTFAELRRGPLRDIPMDLMHGRLSAAEKDAAMLRFRTGETQVLVSTSVVEVGVDVPNATLLTIDSAERFGLAQLHQIRGRISRGTRPGYCCVFASNSREETLERLKHFTTTTDGFALAELDFQLRGPGNLFGLQQHGLPPFRVADLQRDVAILEETRALALETLRDDPGLAAPDFRQLRRQMLQRYGSVLDLGDVG